MIYNSASFWARKGRKLSSIFRRNWQLYVLVALPVFTVFFFHYIPIYGIQIAFKKYSPSRGINGSAWVGFQYFIQFIKYPMFLRLLWNTVRISLYSLLTFPFPVVFAVMLNDLKNGIFKRSVQMLTYAPHFISTVVMCSITILFLSRETGVINTVIELFGGERQEWIAKSNLFAFIYVATDVWQNLGWNSIIYLAALSSLSPELLDAAVVDGATRWKITKHLYIPHLMPTIIVMLLLKMGTLIGVGFEKIFLLQNPLNMDASEVISTYVYNMGIKNTEYSYSAAVGLFETVVNILLVVTFNAISKRVSETSLW